MPAGWDTPFWQSAKTVPNDWSFKNVPNDYLPLV